MTQMLNIALPKGRLGDEALALLVQAGFVEAGAGQDGRVLIFTNGAGDIRFFWAKPSDVTIYVERGAADIGIVGKDCLVEQQPDVYELMDTGLGRCRMCMAARQGFMDDGRGPLRVATKYVNTTRTYFDSIGRDIDIIKLSGSIEIAPIIDLSDCIVDIVQTGRTLAENGLVVVNTLFDISARVIANKANYQFKRARITQVLDAFAAELPEDPAAHASDGARELQRFVAQPADQQRESAGQCISGE